MSKINLDSNQRGILKHLTPAGEYNLLYSIDENILVIQETRQGKNYWISDLTLLPKDQEGRVNLEEIPLHYRTEFHIEAGGDGKKYLIVNPLLTCGAEDFFCGRLQSSLSVWKSRITSNLAIRFFVEEIMGENPSAFTFITGEEFLQIQNKTEEESGLWHSAWDILGVGLGLGIRTYIYGTHREKENRLH